MKCSVMIQRLWVRIPVCSNFGLNICYSSQGMINDRAEQNAMFSPLHKFWVHSPSVCHICTKSVINTGDFISNSCGKTLKSANCMSNNSFIILTFVEISYLYAYQFGTKVRWRLQENAEILHFCFSCMQFAVAHHHHTSLHSYRCDWDDIVLILMDTKLLSSTSDKCFKGCSKVAWCLSKPWRKI